MKCIDCGKHGMVWCAMGETILKSELCCQANGDKPVVTGDGTYMMIRTSVVDPKETP